jgi:hypothetical protein
MDKIVALKEQCLVGRYGKRVGEAVPDVQCRSMAAPAEAAKRVDGDFGLLQGGANDVEAAVAEQKFEIGAAGLALAALDHEGKLDRVTAERRRTGALPSACAKRSASGSPKRMATSAEVSTTIQRHMPVSSWADDLVRAAGVNIRQAAQCLPISISRSAPAIRPLDRLGRSD